MKRLIVVATMIVTACENPAVPGGTPAGWPHYGGDRGGTRYSAADQITPENVDHLQIAWKYRTGDVSDGSVYPSKSAFEATPILRWQTLYLSTPFSRVIALDPETGQEWWTYDPQIDLTVKYSENLVSRGVAAWEDDGNGSTTCARRIFFATLDARLLALDAETGSSCPEFGTNGEVDLTIGVGDVETGEYEMTSPPVVVRDVVAVGSAMGDNRAVTVERGVVRGYDARTGRRLWSWDPVPRSPSDDGWAEWDSTSARLTGAGNAWAPLSADEELGLIYVPTGSASPDMYGGERPGPNLHANSLVVLEAETGRRIWSFQAVHHDVWDYDIASQPTLFTLMRQGARVNAVVQVTKMGHLFFFDRETGDTLVAVEERNVPESDVPGEAASPTQPFPGAVDVLHPSSISGAWGFLGIGRGPCQERMDELRNEGIFTPPSLAGTLVYPHFIGGANWGGVAVDPVRQLLVVNVTRIPGWVRLIPRDRFDLERNAPDAEGQFTAQKGTPYGMNRGTLLSPLGLPCSPPPWGSISAVDLETGKIAWTVPLGTIRDLAPIPLPIRWGTPNLGGPIVTQSGLVFIGAAADNYLRAFDIRTGEELWKGRLPAGGQATPMTYQLPGSKRQYVVIAAGGHGGMGTDLGDYVVAFALPRPAELRQARP